MISAVSNKNQTFTSRSPQIRDAQWVCQKVRSLPHISTTHLKPILEKLEEKNPKIYERFISQTSVNRYIPRTPEEKNVVKFFSWHKNLVRKIGQVRENWRILGRDDYRRFDNVLGQFKYEKLGNCGEDAFLASSILKINGIDNACIAKMRVETAYHDTTNGERIISEWQDHVVCLFNRDGSRFDDKNLKKAIIIDPWIGDADFASNIFVKYKNIFNKFFWGVRENSKIYFQKIDKVNFSDAELELLKRKHADLCYPKSSREFMQKK